MSEHWHHCSWEIDKDSPATPTSKVERRAALPRGSHSIIAEPDSEMWKKQGHGGYRAVSGDYEYVYVVWRCDDSACR